MKVGASSGVFRGNNRFEVFIQKDSFLQKEVLNCRTNLCLNSVKNINKAIADMAFFMYQVQQFYQGKPDLVNQQKLNLGVNIRDNYVPSNTSLQVQNTNVSLEASFILDPKNQSADMQARLKADFLTKHPLFESGLKQEKYFRIEKAQNTDNMPQSINYVRGTPTTRSETWQEWGMGIADSVTTKIGKYYTVDDKANNPKELQKSWTVEDITVALKVANKASKNNQVMISAQKQVEVAASKNVETSMINGKDKVDVKGKERNDAGIVRNPEPIRQEESNNNNAVVFVATSDGNQVSQVTENNDPLVKTELNNPDENNSDENPKKPTSFMWRAKKILGSTFVLALLIFGIAWYAEKVTVSPALLDSFIGAMHKVTAWVPGTGMRFT